MRGEHLHFDLKVPLEYSINFLWLQIEFRSTYSVYLLARTLFFHSLSLSLLPASSLKKTFISLSEVAAHSLLSSTLTSPTYSIVEFTDFAFVGNREISFFRPPTAPFPLIFSSLLFSSQLLGLKSISGSR
jgi:hypothetical protein